jgi:hypothetical protein
MERLFSAKAHWFIGGLMSMIRVGIVAAIALAATLSLTTSAEAQHALGSKLQGLRSNIGSGPGNTAGMGHAAGWVVHSSWGDYWAQNQSMQRPWHGEYYYLKTGQPTALIVPPTVTMQQNYSWGVSQNTMTPNYHQFGGHASNGASGGVFKATPYWPSHTNQFGVYPVRGPW